MYGYSVSPLGDSYMGTPMHPSQVFACIAPIVQHGLMQLQCGASIPHVLNQVAAGAFLTGSGIHPYKAIKIVERWEAMGVFPVPGI